MTMNKFERAERIGKMRMPLAVAMAAALVFTTVTAWACPGGYVPCGEKKQLCCPMH
jgi:hypothetical protein